MPKISFTTQQNPCSTMQHHATSHPSSNLLRLIDHSSSHLTIPDHAHSDFVIVLASFSRCLFPAHHASSCARKNVVLSPPSHVCVSSSLITPRHNSSSVIMLAIIEPVWVLESGELSFETSLFLPWEICRVSPSDLLCSTFWLTSLTHLLTELFAFVND